MPLDSYISNKRVFLFYLFLGLVISLKVVSFPFIWDDEVIIESN